MSSHRDAYSWFSIGGVLTDSLEAFGHNLATFLATAVLAEIPNVAFLVLSAAMQPFATGLHAPLWISILLRIFLSLIEAIVVLVFSCVAQAALVIATISYLNGQPTTLRACLAEGYRSIKPLAAVTVLAALAIAVGLLLLVVPGIILMLGLIVAVPVCVIERKEPRDALRRSWNLTGGHRWAILGVLAIAAICGWSLLAITLALSGAIASGPTTALSALSIMLLVPQTLLFAIGGAMMGAIYYELFFVKERHAPAVPASVFG